MSNKNGSNRMQVPEAKAAMDKFKTEVASELGVNLKEGYNGDLTSREAGSIGGEMVRQMIARQESQQELPNPQRNSRSQPGSGSFLFNPYSQPSQVSTK
jgi:hypothetical protein